MTKVQVIVRLKEGVLDPQGKTAQHALSALGFHQLQNLRIGKFMELELAEDDVAAARAQVEAMCQQLLANPVIEDFEILGD
jgi:phosphoribosylformylglycinamidine synthase